MGAAEAGRKLDISYNPESSVIRFDYKSLNVMHICMQKLQMEMNKSKLMQYELEITLMDSFLLTAENLLNAYFIQYLWDLRTGGSMYTKPMLL